MSEWKKVKLGDCCEITSSKKQDRGQVTVPQEYSKNIISNVTKNEEARHGPVRVPRGAHLYIKGWLPSI